MGRKAQQRRTRRVQERSTSWGTARLAQPLEVVPRSDFGRVDLDELPLAWFGGPSGELVELRRDGTTRPSR
jgi:hypothetical protein